MRSGFVKRRVVWLGVVGAGACVAGVVSLSASSAAKTIAAPKAPSNTLRIAVEQSPDPFDPATLGDNRTIELAQNVFDGLTDISPTTGGPVPLVLSRMAAE